MVMLAKERRAPLGTEGVEVALSVRRAPDGRLWATTPAGTAAVTLRQCFPWSEPDRQLSLRDAEDNEVAFVADPAALDEESRQALSAALGEAGFVLEVTRVVEVEEEVEIRQWTVETRHGRRTFQTHLDDWPRELPGGGLLIRDVAGDLYRFPVAQSLDKSSRELLWAFVD